MGFYAFIGMSVLLAFTFYGMYTYATKQNKDDDK